MRIEVVPFSAQWARDFNAEREQLIMLFRNQILSIDHIGSTAVPGLAAKPIIDIQMGVREVEEFGQREAVEALAVRDYKYRPDLEVQAPYRKFFLRKASEIGADVNLHVVPQDHPWVKRHLIFRDYLRAEASARARYEALKRDLALRDWPDSNAYAHAKTDLVIALEEEAFEFFGLSDGERDHVRFGRI